MIWADRLALAALALAGALFAYLYAASPSWRDAWVEQAEQNAVRVADCYMTLVDQTLCKVIPEPARKVRTPGATALEFLDIAFFVVLPAWLVLRIVEFTLRRRGRRRATLVPE